MLLLQLMLYSSSFVGTLVKNEIPESALELYQLNIKQLSPDILKFRTKHEDNQDNPFTLNSFVVSRSFLFIFHAGPRGLGSNNFWSSSCKEKTAGSARVSRLSFRFLWLWLNTDQSSSLANKTTRLVLGLYVQNNIIQNNSHPKSNYKFVYSSLKNMALSGIGARENIKCQNFDSFFEER